jgi:hypothetical protein
LAALALLALSACLQTEPGEDNLGGDSPQPLEDDSRTAGSSSTTNWPPKSITGGTFYKVFWSADTQMRLDFFEFHSSTATEDIPLEHAGKIQLYRGGTIPALDSARFLEWTFPSTDTLFFPFSKIDSLGKGSGDTLYFNIHLVTDSLDAWIYDLGYSKKERKIINSPSSPLPGSPTFMHPSIYYYQAATADISALLPLPANPVYELGFYIPGTPEFGRAKSDSITLDHLPQGKHPLRVLRISYPDTSPDSTLVEAWELKVAGLGEDSKFTLGGQVLAVRTKGRLTLRDGD